MKKWKLLVTILIAVFVVVIVIIAINHSESLDAKAKAEFTVNLITNILGIAIGAGLAFFFAIRQFQIQASKEKADSDLDMTLKLIERFNSGEMHKARGMADKLILENHTESLATLSDKLPENQTRCVFLVLRFYEQLWYSIQHDKVDIKLVPGFFGEIFYWWYVVCYKDQFLPLGWQAGKNIERLEKWFQKNSEKSERDLWILSAEEDKERRINGEKR